MFYKFYSMFRFGFIQFLSPFDQLIQPYYHFSALLLELVNLFLFFRLKVALKVLKLDPELTDQLLSGNVFK
jgi:hypothetical protein